MARQHFVVTAESGAPPERVFEVLADGARWQAWAGRLVPRSAWEREGEPAPGGVGAVRVLGRPPFVSREQIVAYDPPSHLAYTILSGAPVRDYRADVDLDPTPAGGTRIVWQATFDPIARPLGPLVRRGLAAVVAGFARRLATYADSG